MGWICPSWGGSQRENLAVLARTELCFFLWSVPHWMLQKPFCWVFLSCRWSLRILGTTRWWHMLHQPRAHPTAGLWERGRGCGVEIIPSLP